ncbi:MAG: redoxin domain-containing protein [Phycisphaerae bacterium]
MSQRWFELIILIIAFLVATSPFTRADDQPRDAEAIVRGMIDHMDQVSTFRTQANMEWRCDDPDFPLIDAVKYTIAYGEPNRFSLKQKSGDLGADVISDGTALMVAVPFRSAYTLNKTGGTKDGLKRGLDSAATMTNMPGIELLNAMANKNLSRFLLDGVVNFEHVGDESAGGKRCNRIRLERTESWSECWIAQGKKPALMRYTTDMQNREQRFGNRTRPKKMRGFRAEVSFKKWKFDGKVRDKMFAIKPPKKLEAVPTLSALVHARPPHPLLGTKAPKLQLDDLNGSQFNLADHRNESIVVVDFWATWCGPCRAAFPTLIEVTSRYADRGVKFIAVNVNENTSLVRDYLKTTGFNLNVVMDEEGKIARAYQAHGLPQTVIVDRDGSVQAVHQGFSQTLRQQLTEELDALLAGKKLAGKR